VKLREIESWGVKLRVFEDQGGYFKMAGSSGGSCEVSPTPTQCGQLIVSYYWTNFLECHNVPHPNP
jgi:hypothetical protein